MSFKITAFTQDCCQLVRALLPTNDDLVPLVMNVSTLLQVEPDECLQLIMRTDKPTTPPAFDGKHEEADWYDNNLQMPRLLLAICDHLGITDSLPSSYGLDEKFNFTLTQSQSILNSYVKRKLALIN